MPIVIVARQCLVSVDLPLLACYSAPVGAEDPIGLVWRRMRIYADDL
ncbi:hypothetical protein [Pyrobaculum sp.]